MFRTEIPLTPLPHQLPPSARVLTLGSCFSDAIGARLTEFKVATLVNPFGTVFNPISACKLLRAAAGEDVDWQQHLVEARGRWQSYDLHAEIGADSPVELLQHISQLTREVGVFLATADVVVLTLGSAFAYRLRETDELVSNCHKVAADQFGKELLTADDIIAAVAETHAYLRRINPKLRFVLTVSPVRHLKDTLVLNSASKAMLRVACHYLSELLPDVTYFPAYELLMDDLRDYRFYATDMLHLSETAENYVWEKFTRMYFDAAFGRFKKEWEGIRQNLNHRPLHPAAPEHRAFLESTLERLRKLSGTADVRMELLHVERELASLPEPKTAAPVEEEVYDDGEERIDIGSFDDQAAIDEAQPVAAAQVAAAPEPAPRKDAARKQPAKPEVSRAAVFAKTRLTSQASLIRPGAGLLVEDAEETEPETADTETDEATVSADSAYDHAYSPAVTDLTDEVEADEAQDTDETDESDEDHGPETAEEAARRKKRRSRGGAKRTKRKHARLAAEQGRTEGQPEDSAVATSPAPLPDEVLPHPSVDAAEADEEPASDVVYVTEAELRQPRTQPAAATSAPPEAAGPEDDSPEGDTEPAVSEADETTPEVRRSRNNRRGNKREQAPRYGGRPGRQPLYAADAENAPAPTDAAPEAPETASAVPSGDAEPIMPAPAVATPTSSAPVATDTAQVTAAATGTDKKPATRKRPAKAKARPEPVAEAAAPEAAAPAETSAPTTAAAKPAAEPETAEIAPAKTARRKPVAKARPADAATTVPEAAEAAGAAPAKVLPEPTEAPAPKAAAKPKAAVKAPAKAAKPKKATTTAATAVAPEPASEVTAATQASEATKAAPKPKPAAKKAPAKAKPAAKAADTATKPAADAPAAPVKAPAKPRTRAATKPAKKAGPEAPEEQ